MVPSLIMQKSCNIASVLLAVDSKKGTDEEGRIKAHPVILGILNLFFCGYVDQFLQHDVDGHYLSLFFFVEAALLILVAITAFVRSGSEIIHKSTVFPSTSTSRLLFVFWGNLRRSASIALWLTTGIFVVVFYSATWLIAIGALMVFVLMVLAIEMLTAGLCLWLTKSSHPIMGFAVVSMLVVFGMMISSVIFRQNTLLSSMPILSFAVDAIVAMQRVAIRNYVINAVLLAASFSVIFIVGVKRV